MTRLFEGSKVSPLPRSNEYMKNIRIRTTKERRKTRSSSDICGTADRPRLSVYRSNKYIYAQIIDDALGKTLVTIDDISKLSHKKTHKKAAAFELGKKLAERAKKIGVSSVLFDKGPYKYHGRVKSLAEGAREGGLAF